MQSLFDIFGYIAILWILFIHGRIAIQEKKSE